MLLVKQIQHGHTHDELSPPMSSRNASTPYQPAPRSENSSIVAWLLAIACFLCPATSWQLIPGALSWSDAFLLAAGVAYLPIAMLRKDGFQLPTLMLAAVAFIVIAFMGSSITNPGLPSLINCLKLLVSLFFVPIVIMWVTVGRVAAMDRLLWFWLAGGCLSALVGVCAKYGISLFGLKEGASAGARISGLTYHPNVLGYACALLLPVGIYLLSTVRSNMARMACIVAIGLLAYAVQLTGSRASLLAALIGSAVWLPNPFRLKMHQSEFFILIAGGLGIVALVFFITLNDKASAKAEDSLSRLFGDIAHVRTSNEARNKQTQIAYDRIQESPIFGKGFYEYTRYAHNTSLQMLQSGGLVGFLGILLWWGGMARCWWQVRNTALPHQEFMLLQMIMSITLIVLINGAFEPFLIDRASYIAFGILLGLWLSLRFNQSRLE